MIFARILPLAAFCAVAAVAAVAVAQDTDTDYLTKEEAAGAERRLQGEVERQLLDVEQRLFDDGALTKRRIEQVETRIDLSEQQVNTLLGIFALMLLLGFFFVAGNLRARQQLSSERVARVTRDAENLMRDIQRELNRPELEYLRISQMLRRLVRQLRSPDPSLSGAQYIPEMRAACNDPYLPASLYFMARVLSAEHDGNWNIAAQMLEQLREMDASDPDVLLHLSHVHKNIAVNTADREVRNRHQRMSYQYYAQFASAMKSEEMRTDELQQPEKIPPPPKGMRETPPPQPPEAQPPVAEKPRMPLPAAAREVPPASAIVKPQEPAAVVKRETPPASVIAKPQEAAAVVRRETPPVSAIAKPQESAAPVRRETPPASAIAKPQEPAAAVKRETPPPPQPAAAQPAAAESPQKQSTPAAPAAAAANKAGASTGFKDKIARIGGINNIRASGGAVTSAVGSGLKKSFGGFRNFIKVENDGPLPFLPVPGVSEVPVDAANNASDRQMWGNIVRGDRSMTLAASAKSVRERNRLIDSAVTCYTQAQAYNTNRVLYHNWGIALLAKALHVPEKKRAPMFNAAVDKFMAGNVVSPHYFDFHLASLYAIIGDKRECLKWLETARKSGNLDVESLMQAPDFDAVRNEPWFDQFLGT